MTHDDDTNDYGDDANQTCSAVTRILGRFIRSSSNNRELYTLAYFALEGSESQAGLVDAVGPIRPDANILAELLGHATPKELSDVLWSSTSRALPPEQFHSLFSRSLREVGDDERRLWRLCGAACDYLRFHPGAFSIPSALSTTLLASSDPDRRVIGLKAIRHVGLPAIEQLSTILDLLQHPKHEMDLYAALYQLAVWIEDFPSLTVPEPMALALRSALEGIRDLNSNEDLRKSAAVRIEQLQDANVL